MKLKYSDDRKVFNIHTDGIPCLSFDMLDSLGVPPESILFDNFG